MANKKEVEEQTTLDKLNSNLGSASEKIVANKKVIFWIVGAIAVVAAFVISYLFIYRNPYTNKAFEAYNEVEMKAQGNDSIATADLKKVADQYGNTDAGQLAALEAGEKLYDAKKYEEAAKYLEKADISEPVLSSCAQILTGDCYVNLKKYDKALEWFNKGIKTADKNPQIVPAALKKMAVVYDEQKKYDKALDCYKQIKADYPEFMAQQIDAYIAREEARLGK